MLSNCLQQSTQMLAEHGTGGSGWDSPSTAVDDETFPGPNAIQAAFDALEVTSQHCSPSACSHAPSCEVCVEWSHRCCEPGGRRGCWRSKSYSRKSAAGGVLALSATCTCRCVCQRSRRCPDCRARRRGISQANCAGTLLRMYSMGHIPSIDTTIIAGFPLENYIVTVLHCSYIFVTYIAQDAGAMHTLLSLVVTASSDEDYGEACWALLAAVARFMQTVQPPLEVLC